MLRFLNNFKISTRIAALAGLSLLTVLGLAGLFYWTTQTTTASVATEQGFADVQSRSQDLQIHALSLRRDEKDFLLQRDLDHVTRFDTEFRATLDQLASLRALDQARDLQSALDEAEEQVLAYQTAFHTVVDIRTNMGLTAEEGLEGELRGAVHAVETQLNAFNDAELSVKMLMMRRHEKDFMMRVETKYIDRLDSRVAEFFEIWETREYDAQTTRTVTDLMQTYQTGFHNWTSARLELEAALQALDERFSALEPSFRALDTAARAGRAEALDRMHRDIARTLGFAAVVILIAGLVVAALSAAIGHSIVSPIKEVTRLMADLAGGKDVPVTGQTRRDEIGAMARTLDVFQRAMTDAARLRDEQIAAEAEARRTRQRERHELADAFDQSIGAIIKQQSNAAAMLSQTASNLQSAAQSAGAHTTDVVGAAQLTSANTQAVATATEELSGSVREITRQVENSVSSSDRAVIESTRSRETISELAMAVDQIGDVVTIIHSVAEQTNLLALNATIEAARAGEAGRGFAVVAGEVKALAAQTGQATDTIRTHIEGIRNRTDAAVHSIDQVADTIEILTDASKEVGRAVTQQGEATREIAGHISEAATGAGVVSTSMESLSLVVADTTGAASHVLCASDELNTQAQRLEEEVSSFVTQFRAG